MPYCCRRRRSIDWASVSSNHCKLCQFDHNWPDYSKGRRVPAVNVKDVYFDIGRLIELACAEPVVAERSTADRLLWQWRPRSSKR